jgi:hypothetical protein
VVRDTKQDEDDDDDHDRDRDQTNDNEDRDKFHTIIGDSDKTDSSIEDLSLLLALL